MPGSASRVAAWAIKDIRTADILGLGIETSVSRFSASYSIVRGSKPNVLRKLTVRFFGVFFPIKIKEIVPDGLARLGRVGPVEVRKGPAPPRSLLYSGVQSDRLEKQRHKSQPGLSVL